jgi:uncharacterized SAM-binding protein YcdF (DUF218 family)
MYIYLSKILPLFVMPVSMVLVLILVALLLLRHGRIKIASACLGFALLVLWAASTPIVAESFYRHLESRYPPVPLAEITAGDCIILLGGVVGAPLPPRVEIELNESVDRVYKTAQLFRAGKGRAVIVTGGNQPWSDSPWAEADLIRELLEEWGVKSEAIFLEGSSRNTRENAVYSKNLIDAIHCTTPLLVTSAAHMPRSVAAFQSVGVGVIPVSTDVRTINNPSLEVMSFLPNASALAMTSDATREWIGQKVYEFQGWN